MRTEACVPDLVIVDAWALGDDLACFYVDKAKGTTLRAANSFIRAIVDIMVEDGVALVRTRRRDLFNRRVSA